MLYIWMPETNGVWHWSNGENWLQAASLDQLIQDLQIHQGKESYGLFSESSCSNASANDGKVPLQTAWR